MILKKLTAAFIAASTAIIPFTAGTLNVFTPLNAYSEETADVSSFPDWIPQSFDDAVNFRNKYGVVHIGDENDSYPFYDSDLLCVVFKETSYSTKKYDIKNTGGLVTVFYHDTFVDEDADTAYEVMTYKNASTSKPDFKVQFSCDAELQKEYSFTSIGTQVVETDIYSWLPDCEEEYRKYAESNTNLSVKDNYVVFCLSHDAGTAYDWVLNDTGKECFELETVSDCSPESSVPVDGGEINKVCVYKAVKDGYDKISYDFVLLHASDDEGKKSLVADCAVINDAKSILLSGDMRVSLVDYDTGELLTLPEMAIQRIWTDISKDTPEGKINCNMFPVGFGTNPAVVDLGNFFDGYNFSFGLDIHNLPVGYYLQDTNGKSAGYYNGTVVPDDHMIIKKYDNGSADVVFKLKFTPTGDINDDDEFNVADLVLLQKWLLGSADAKLINWKAADFCNDNVLNVFDLCLMRKALIQPINIPVSLSITKTGGYAGVHIVWKVYKDDGKYILSYDDQKGYESNEPMIVEISEADYSEIMSLNYDWIIDKYNKTPHEKVIDGFNYKTILSYENGDEKETRADMTNVLVKLEKLLDKYLSSTTYVEPDKRTTNGSPLRVMVNDLKLYSGPNESYQAITLIPNGTRLHELGYQTDNDKWLFTEYKGRYGWIKTIEDDNRTVTIYFDEYLDKPVIYLYPEETTDVHVELELTEAELSTTYPKYNNGWDVTAYPDGKLINKADGTHHRYLFWDAANCRTRFDFSKGFCVAGSDTESFLKEKLAYMGLNEDEMNEFIVYWLPLMEHNKYNLISFQGDVYTNSAKLNITPTPDSLLRVFMAYVPLEEAVDIEPQQLETFERKGFAVVEWGGSKVQ